jgi:hypothetical protein
MSHSYTHFLPGSYLTAIFAPYSLLNQGLHTPFFDDENGRISTRCLDTAFLRSCAHMHLDEPTPPIPVEGLTYFVGRRPYVKRTDSAVIGSPLCLGSSGQTGRPRNHALARSYGGAIHYQHVEGD